MKFPWKLRNRLLGLVYQFPQVSKLSAERTPQFGEYAVELLGVVEADRLVTKQTNAFLQRGEGHGPVTMPQTTVMFDTVHTVDDLRVGR